MSTVRKEQTNIGKDARWLVREIKKQFIGGRDKYGLMAKLILYLLMMGIGFVFVYPLLIVFSTSGKDLYDLVNPLVRWIPTSFCVENYQKAYRVLGGVEALAITVLVISAIAFAQTASSSLVGYGLAKFRFPGKRLVLGLVVATFIIPSQVTLLPQFVMYSQLSLVNSVWPILLPSLFCQGLKNAIFVLLFYQFFRMAPKSLDEAATVDGAGRWKIFYAINLKMATPAIVVVLIFSFVWNWNETNLADIYFGNAIVTLPLALERFKESYDNLFPFDINNSQPATRLNEGIEMAGTVLSIIPLIVMYIFVEKHLVENFDRSGITGE